MGRVPDWWAFVILTLGAYRAWRLLAVDEILDGPRDRLVRVVDDRRYRERLDTMIRCPWCLGAWILLAVWILWWVWPHETLVVAAPAAASALLGLTQHNLDR